MISLTRRVFELSVVAIGTVTGWLESWDSWSVSGYEQAQPKHVWIFRPHQNLKWSKIDNLVVTSPEWRILGAPAPKPHPPSMPPFSAYEYYCTFRYTHDINRLQRVHCEVSKELFQRLLGPMNDPNPDLSGATVSELLGILRKVFDQMMVIVSFDRALRDDLR